ncbi:hypothetical protein GS909_20175 [Rhodococcus hoagii]|nr:hypothetical protein [Prescottella equi]
MFRGELTLHVRREYLPTAARRLRDDPALRFELCLGVSGVHYPQDPGRELHGGIRSCPSPTGAGSAWKWLCPMPTRTSRRLYGVYPTTDWHERETYDFFGIVFDGHPALHPNRDARRLDGAPAAQGLPPRRRSRRVQGAKIPPPDERRAYQ